MVGKKETVTLKEDRQSDTCSANSLAGSRIIARGVRILSYPVFGDGVFASSSTAHKEAVTCPGKAEAIGADSPPDPGKGVVKSNVA